MRRLVVGLLVLAGCWFGYRELLAADRTPVDVSGLEELASTPTAGPEAGSPEAAPLQARSGGQPRTEAPSAAATAAPAATTADRIRQGVLAGDTASLAVGYATLRRSSGDDRRQLALALQDGGGGDVTRDIAALGQGNDFLHCAEGRRHGEAVIEAALREPPEAGAAHLTELLEKAMRGPITPGDTDARAFVDKAYAALQRPLNRTVFNPAFVAGARQHVVAEGDYLNRIAAVYRKQDLKIEGMTLAILNRIDPRALRPGLKLKIPVEPIRTVIEKRSFLMAVYVGSTIARLYWIGHGKNDCTPETSFTIGAKKEKPDWYVDGRVIPYGHPDNCLGEYFVKFDHPSLTGFGAHGTNEPESIGAMGSAGCIRMRDADIEEFFQLVPRGTEVVIRASE